MHLRSGPRAVHLVFGLVFLLGLADASADCRKCGRLFDRSIRDAAVFETAHQSGDLLPIEEMPVVVVTWTSWTGYQPGPTTLTRDVWVSVVPQLREACRRFEPKKLDLRLRQYLGLPPDDEKTLFVELEVARAEDIFRPCTDPAIDTPGPCTAEFSDGVSEEHAAWMARQAFSSWKVPKGYPWTRLGYTYDWNPKTDRYGASEYVVRSGKQVEVLSVVPTAQYCRPAPDEEE